MHHKIWVSSHGATLGVGSWLMKVFVICLAYFFSRKMEKMTQGILFFISMLGCILAVNTVILIVYTVVIPKEVHVLQGQQGLGKFETKHVCAVTDEGNRVIY